MKRITLLLAIALLFSVGARAQKLNTYTVSTNNEPYVSIASTGTQLTSVVGDMGWQTFALPFDFPFGEHLVAQGTQVLARADGHIVLDRQSIPSGNPPNGYDNAYNYYNASYHYYAIVPFLLRDGQMPAGNSACYWQTEIGTDGEQVLVVEFQHVQHYQGNNDNFNYQIRLYANGNVSVHYGHLENNSADTSFTFMMVAKGVDERVILMGSWDAPTALSPTGISGVNGYINPTYCLGLPDSGLVVTYERPDPPCPRPINIRVTDLMPTSATLTWTPNGVSGCTYMIAYDTLPHADSYLDINVDVMTNDSVYIIDNLLSNKHYYVYLRSHCGSDSSSWQSLDFWTPCEPMPHSVLPFAEDFQATPSTGASLYDPGCWRRSAIATVCNASSIIPSRCLRMSTGNDHTSVMVSLPPMDSVADLEVSFSAMVDDGYMEVGVIDEAGNWDSFVPVQAVSLTDNVWADRTVRLGGYDGQGNTIAFRLTKNADLSAFLYVDNIDVHLAQGCLAVEDVVFSNITDTSATIGWTDPEHSGSYRVTLVGNGQPVTFATTDTTFDFTGLTLNSDYNVTVVSLCDEGMSAAVTASFRTRNSCVPPARIFCTGVTSTALTVSWEEPFAVVSYDVTCGTQSQTVTGVTSCTFTGLSPDSTYIVTVRRHCADGLTDAATANFTTECIGNATLPWNEDFDDWSNDVIGDCWTLLVGPDSYSGISVFDGFGYHCLCMKGEIWQGDTNRSYVVLPPMAMSYQDLSFSLNVMGYNSDSSNALLELGVIVDGSDRSTFTVFDTVPFADRNFDQFDYYEKPLYGIGNGRLALRFTSLNSFKLVYVDNFTLIRSTSCAYPDSLTVDSIGLTTLGVSIADDDSAGRYRLWWSDGTQIDSVDITGYAYTIGGLHHSTRYQLTAAAICPSDSTLSTRVTTTVTTACGVFSHAELPYEENFDDGIGTCSRFIDYYYPNNRGDRTTANHHLGDTGRALAPNVGDSSQPFYYILPEVDSLGDLAIEFWLKVSVYANHDMVTVGVMTDPADTSTFTAVQTVYPTVADVWEKKHVSLGCYSGPGRHVALRFGLYRGPWSWSPVIDDLSLKVDFPCLAPDSVSVAAVTDTSATLVVHDPRGVGHYRLYSFGVPTDFYSDTIVVNGLYPAYDYTFQVAAVCADSVATFPVQVSLTTLCGTLSLPYNDDFERYELYKLPPCWTLTEQASREPAVRSSSELGQLLYGSLYSGDSLVSFSTPTLRIDEEDVHVTFNVYASQRYTDEHYHSHPVPTRMQISFLGDTMSSRLVLFDDSLAATAISSGIVMQPIEINTFDLPLGTGKFYFTFFHDTLYPSATLIFALDSLSVYTIHHELPCQAVDSIAVDSVTLTTAVVSWVPRGPEEAWILHLFVNNSDTAITTDTPRVHLTGLNQGTDYAFIIIPLCYTAIVTEPVFFTTLACPEVTDVEVSAIAAHTATVSWTAPTEGPWIIEYGPVGFNQGFGTQVTVPAQAAGRVTYLLDSLQSETAYDLYVMTLCDEGKTSVWSPVRHFTTEVDGIENPQFSILDSQFLITPNPAHGSVTLSGLNPGATVTIRDASGRKIADFKIQNSKSKIDITTLPAGVYFLTASTSTTTSTRKLIVR